jgi:C-terminal processing protease CtpA/Prc
VARVRIGIEAALNPNTATVSGSVRFKIKALGATLLYEKGRLVIVSTKKKGPMAKAGLRKGDVVLTLQGETPNPENLLALVSEAARKGMVRLTMERDGWRKDFVLKPKGGKPADVEEDF